jgi:hypothetical protein
LLTLQLGGDVEKLFSVQLTNKFAATAGVESITWYDLIYSSAEGGGDVVIPVPGFAASSIKHRLRGGG